jgi:hypothetical protein
MKKKADENILKRYFVKKTDLREKNINREKKEIVECLKFVSRLFLEHNL